MLIVRERILKSPLEPSNSDLRSSQEFESSDEVPKIFELLLLLELEELEEFEELEEMEEEEEFKEEFGSGLEVGLGPLGLFVGPLLDKKS